MENNTINNNSARAAAAAMNSSSNTNPRVALVKREIMMLEGMLKTLGREIPEWRIGDELLSLEEKDGDLILHTTGTKLGNPDLWFARATGRFLAECSKVASDKLMAFKKFVKALNPEARADLLVSLNYGTVIDSDEVGTLWSSVEFSDLTSDVQSAYSHVWRMLLIAQSAWTDLESGMGMTERPQPFAYTLSNQLDSQTSDIYGRFLAPGYYDIYEDAIQPLRDYSDIYGLLDVGDPLSFRAEVEAAWERVLDFTAECLRVSVRDNADVLSVWDDDRHDTVEILINYAFRTMNKTAPDSLIASITNEWITAAMKAKDILCGVDPVEFTHEVTHTIEDMLRLTFFYTFRREVITRLTSGDPLLEIQYIIRREALENEVRKLRSNI